MKLHLPSKLRAAVLACMSALAVVNTTVATCTLAGGAFAVMVGTQAWGAKVNDNQEYTDPQTLTSNADFEFNANSQGHYLLYQGGLDIAGFSMKLHTTYTHSGHVQVNGLKGTGDIYLDTTSYSGQFTNALVLLSLTSDATHTADYSGTIYVGKGASDDTGASAASTALVLGSGSVAASANVVVGAAENGCSNFLGLTGDVTINRLDVTSGTLCSVDSAWLNEGIKVVSQNVVGSDQIAQSPTITKDTIANNPSAQAVTLTLNGNSSLNGATVQAGVKLHVASGATLTLSGNCSLAEEISNQGNIVISAGTGLTGLQSVGTAVSGFTQQYKLTADGSTGTVDVSAIEGASYDAATGALTLTGTTYNIIDQDTKSITEVVAAAAGKPSFTVLVNNGGTLSVGGENGSIGGEAGQIANDNITFQDGSTLQLSHGAVVSVLPKVQQNATINLVIANDGDNTTTDATWNAGFEFSSPQRNGISSISVQEGAKFVALHDSEQWPAFNPTEQ